MTDIHPELLVQPAGASVQLEARVQADKAQKLPWRLKVEVVGPGGRSSVNQSGVSDGSGAVVTRTAVNADAKGRAVLQVDAPDGSTIERTVELEGRGPEPKP